VGVACLPAAAGYVTAVEWWAPPDFGERPVLEAAEMVAFDVLDPALRSRGAPQGRARELYDEAAFRKAMHDLFSGEPAGQLVIRTLEDALLQGLLGHKRDSSLPPVTQNDRIH
jgi:hypothetical protein